MPRNLTAVFIVCALFIVSCKPDGASTVNNQNQNVLRYDVSSPFTSLNPVVVSGYGSTHVFPLLYSFLFVPDEHGKLQPDLAVSWTPDPGNRAWTIHLRKGVLFHNRQPVTSRDVRYSLEAYSSKARPYLSPLTKRFSILSDTAVRIKLDKGDPDFPRKIWDCAIIPEPQSGQADYDNRPVGSGPFKFASRRGREEIVLVANEDYHDGRPALDGVVFSYQPDKEKSWTRLLSGETDVAFEIAPMNYEMTKQYENQFYFELYTIPSYTILLYNTNDFLFRDRRVRQALSHAIDREYIVKNILRRFGVVAVGPMGVDSPYRNPELKPVSYDPKEGLRLLREAGWACRKEGDYLTKDGRRFEFTILAYAGNETDKKVAEYIRLCLNDIGIRVHVQAFPHDEVAKRYYRNDEFQTVLTEFNTGVRVPEQLSTRWCMRGGQKSHAGGFHDPGVSCLIDKALGEKAPVRRQELFHELDALIASLQPGTFLFQKTAINLMSRRFRLPGPFSLAHEGIYRLKHASRSRN